MVLVVLWRSSWGPGFVSFSFVFSESFPLRWGQAFSLPTMWTSERAPYIFITCPDYEGVLDSQISFLSLFARNAPLWSSVVDDPPVVFKFLPDVNLF